jgi:hypothetical protein
MEIICAFSSDSRTLYQADIYRVLALPKGHVTHFRYKKMWVDNNLLSPKKNLKNKKVAIFYTHGNTSEEDTSEKHISIRWAKICHTETSEETDVFHVYMKLDEFANIAIDSGNSVEKQPPTKYFSKLTCTETLSDNNWQARVLAIKDHFPKITYFHLKSIHGKCKEVNLKYENSDKFCFYNLTHGNRYTLKLALGNPGVTDLAGNTTQSNSKIEIHDSSDEITINCINPLETSIQFDDYDIPISVKTLQVMKQASLLRFSPTEKDQDFGEFPTNIELNLNLTLWRPFIFGLFSVMAFWALLLARPMSSSVEWASPLILVLSSIMLWLASGSLFFWFNKK